MTSAETSELAVEYTAAAISHNNTIIVRLYKEPSLEGVAQWRVEPCDLATHIKTQHVEFWDEAQSLAVAMAKDIIEHCAVIGAATEALEAKWRTEQK